MKYILFLFITISLVACLKNDIIKLDNLDLKHSAAFFPIQYLEAEGVLMKNIDGDTILFDVFYTDSLNNKSFEGVNYEVNEIIIKLLKDDYPSIDVNMTSSAFYSTEETFIERLNIWGTSEFNCPSAWVTIFSDPSMNVDYLETWTIDGVTFSEVYTNFKEDGVFPCTNLYYNKEFGLVGIDGPGIVPSYFLEYTY